MENWDGNFLQFYDRKVVVSFVVWSGEFLFASLLVSAIYYGCRHESTAKGAEGGGAVVLCGLLFFCFIRKGVYMARKTVLVTGASRGIGKAIAVKYAKKGYNTVITCVHREEQLLQTQREIEACNVSCLSWLGDAGDYHSCEELFGRIRKQFGSLDVLVNNAGISYIGLLQDMKPDEWDRIMRTNLTSVFNCCRLAIPLMLTKKQGKIINISSVWGVCGASCEVAYSATKGGVNAFTKALAKELAPSNIQVNAIACGAIDTEMNHFLHREELIGLLEEIPAGRMGRAEEVADLAYHLGYKESYLTGQIIGLDGGWI